MDFGETEAFEVFFDGACPLCSREIALLRAWVPPGQVRFTDLMDDQFELEPGGPSHDDLMAEIHGRHANGRWVTGVEVFRILYAAAGWKRCVAISRLPGIRNLLNVAYAWFAKNRLRLTGRCDTERVCAIRTQNQRSAVGGPKHTVPCESVR